MLWDYSFSSFKLYGPDHPDHVDFDAIFEGGPCYALLQKSQLPDLIDRNRISFDKDLIFKDINTHKWDRLIAHVGGNHPVTPPWGMLGKNGLMIVQGCHRFQFAVVSELDPIPVVLSVNDAISLKAEYGIQVFQMSV